MQIKLDARPEFGKVDTMLPADDLIVKRKGGGSIIEQRQLFSNDGETLYIIWKHLIRAYSTQTGDFVRDFEAVDHRISGIVLHPDNVNTVIGCTENGELVFWSCQSGIITKKLKLHFKDQPKVKTFHIVNYKTWKGNEICQALVTYVSKCHNKIYVLLFDIDNGICVKSTFIATESFEYYVDIIGNHGENLIALLHDLDLHILNPAVNLTDKLHKTGKTGRTPTCIAGHPEEECVATGDSTGRIVVWRSLFQTRPNTAVFHWHTLPVTEIVFSKSGGHMYSGGGECVLVKWTLANPQNKSFLPRLPAPIKHLTIAPDNLYVAVSTLDNGIVVVNPQRKLTSVIQNFTWGVAVSSKELFLAGLVVDPRTQCLVLNSRTGHVQFYNTRTKSLLYNINITAQNFLTQERSAIIVNTEVTKIALNEDGTWMATVEERNDKLSCMEVRLKFWAFDTDKQTFALNTSIEMPHEGGVAALQFQPKTFCDKSDWLAVTTGRDKKFKLWNLVDSVSAFRKTKHWQCYSTADYRDLSIADATFSMDGSLLGIGFDCSLTMWTPETCTLKCSLAHNQYRYPITRIEFGKHEACHLVVAASSGHIAVWDILSLTLTWSVSLNLVTLAADPKSVYMAAFTNDNTLYVFSPEKSLGPHYVKKKLIEEGSSVLAATFVPHQQERRGDARVEHWQQKSQLYFLDSNQELLTLEPQSEVNVCLEILSTNGTNVPATAFGNLLAAKNISTKEKMDPFIYEQPGLTGRGMTDELLSVSAHTLPPMKMLCAPFISSLLTLSLSKNQNTDEKLLREGTAGGEEEDSDAENESELSGPAKIGELVLKCEHEDVVVDSSKLKLVSYDWLFLSTILPDEQESIDQ